MSMLSCIFLPICIKENMTYVSPVISCVIVIKIDVLNLHRHEHFISRDTAILFEFSEKTFKISIPETVFEYQIQFELPRVGLQDAYYIDKQETRAVISLKYILPNSGFILHMQYTQNGPRWNEIMCASGVAQGIRNLYGNPPANLVPPYGSDGIYDINIFQNDKRLITYMVAGKDHSAQATLSFKDSTCENLKKPDVVFNQFLLQAQSPILARDANIKYLPHIHDFKVETLLRQYITSGNLFLSNDNIHPYTATKLYVLLDYLEIRDVAVEVLSYAFQCFNINDIIGALMFLSLKRNVHLKHLIPILFNRALSRLVRDDVELWLGKDSSSRLFEFAHSTGLSLDILAKTPKIYECEMKRLGQVGRRLTEPRRWWW